MSGKVGSITTGIIADGLIFNMDAANRASTIPSTSTLKTFNTVDTSISGAFSDNGIFDSSTISPSYAFGGTDDRIESSNFTQLNSTSDFSVSVWVKAASGAQADNYAYIISTGPSDGSKLQIGISQNDTSNQLNFMIRNSSDTSYTTLAGVENFFNGNWRNIVITYDGATMSFYTDSGTLLTTSHTGVLPIQSNMVLSIGASPTQNYFNGNIGPVQIYNRALSPTEILHNYNALKGRFA